ncbi:Phytocyanin domain-containing protein, partial [Psidium guajava]
VSLGLVLLGCSVMATMLVGSASAMLHVVGGRQGWDVPDNVTFYQDWAKPRTFGVGDQLIFPYRPGSNNLLIVKKKDYEACDMSDPIDIYYMGPTILNLTAVGDYYYVSSSGRHCEYGQRLHITVGKGPGSSG